jgi:hypothetical protein
MKSPTRSGFAGLLSVEGIEAGYCALSRPVRCPFCSSHDAAIMSGNISFVAKMNGQVLTDKVPLSAFVCANSHLFFLRASDIAAAEVAIEVQAAPANTQTTDTSSNWPDLYRAAVMEDKVEDLPWKIGLAADAIQTRLKELCGTANASIEEKRRLDQALLDLIALIKVNAA